MIDAVYQPRAGLAPKGLSSSFPGKESCLSVVRINGIPSIAAGFDMMHMPIATAYAVIGLLCVLTLWPTVYLVRAVWRVEHELDAARHAGEKPSAC
jgi:hypothetical protein